MTHDMHGLMLAAAPDVFAGTFAAVAATLLIAGAILLRSQRSRQQFALLQTAMEKGLARLPGTPPFWLMSLRSGLTTLALGVGLVLVGGGVMGAAKKVPPPPPANITAVAPEPAPQPAAQPVAPGEPGLPPGLPPRPAPRSPALDAWDRAQSEIAISGTAIACGVILALLGVVRAVFAIAEKRYTDVATV